MKLLTIHSDYLKYEAKKKAIDSAKEPEQRKEDIDECLIAFQGVEKVDEEDPEKIAEKTVEEIKDIVKKVNTDTVVLYPFVHLTEDPGSPSTAVRVLNKEEKLLKETDLEIHRSPFGWYKAFDLKCKGHPLAELSRKITSEEKEEPAKEREGAEELRQFIIIDREGKEHEINPERPEEIEFLDDSREHNNLKKYIKYEEQGQQIEEEPPHIKLMKEHELVDYCEVSDAGHFKWHPKGLIIKELILDYQDELAREYGAFKIQNPLLYRLGDERTEKLIGEFNEKIYSWEEDGDELALRPASDPGQFPYAQNLDISYKQLPLKQYEASPCFRKEQRGELTGLRRVRNFFMTDMHTFTANEEKAQQEFEELSFVCKDIMNSVISKGDWIVTWTGTEEYWEKNKGWIKKITKEMEVPGLVRLSKERTHYYDMKIDYQAIHPQGTVTEVSTVQMDRINGERFNIKYTGKDNKQHPCTILHCSTFGSIERTLSFMLEDALREDGKNPMLPIWLSPAQVRLIPVSEDSMEYTEKVADKIQNEDIRVDIDDEDESVGKKIRRAEKEWVPVTIVIGPDEEESGVFEPRLRKEDEEKKMSLEEIQNYIHKETAGYPYKPLPLPKKLSERPQFR